MRPSNLDIADQTIKAQLIYVSFFDNAKNSDANFYANLFKAAHDDATMIDAINQNYGLVIDYEQYMHLRRIFHLLLHVLCH